MGRSAFPFGKPGRFYPPEPCSEAGPASLATSAPSHLPPRQSQPPWPESHRHGFFRFIRNLGVPSRQRRDPKSQARRLKLTNCRWTTTRGLRPPRTNASGASPRPTYRMIDAAFSADRRTPDMIQQMSSSYRLHAAPMLASYESARQSGNRNVARSALSQNRLGRRHSHSRAAIPPHRSTKVRQRVIRRPSTARNCCFLLDGPGADSCQVIR